ncbi:PAS domain S-box protein [Neorhizobium sp. T786]|uniref:hybrid sensor histidine kinase/response regulator n=1 Tax=Pseudorhizobium xiangyangii TaxID=2883104 RepID=UPI001CFFE7D8|nr:PAS domain-containing sensor histidine kinase [Neorhizobium xiangyangii]MCB5203825.1 PAS domain S-box protein [Neorhizobium xiangyangii]
MTAYVSVLQSKALDDRYRVLVDAITDYAIYMLDITGHVSSWNSGANRFKGYTEAEILGEHFSRFYTPEDREAGMPQRALSVAATEGRFEAEGWRVRKDGTRFWAHVVIDAIRDQDGQLVGFAKITRDLSERKIAEEALMRSEEQFRMLVQGVTDYAIYMLDPRGCVASWNQGAERIKGYNPEEIIGEHFSRFYTAEDKDDGLPGKALEIAARAGRFEKEGWRVRKDGSRFWANVIIDAIKAEDGSLIGYAKVTRDITEKREVQLALERAQLDLFQSQKMEAVGQLVGGVAHDFNNLLMAVLGSLEIARKRALAGENVVDLIDHAVQGAKRGASLTQRLLAFSRKQELALEAVDIPRLINGMAELLQRTIGPTVELTTSYPLVLPNALSDPNQLESALLNLVVNARDAITDGGLIKIEARRKIVRDGEVAGLGAGDYICLSVSDEGEGMDAATLEGATTPFFTTKGVGKGTGLGLSMVQGLMAQSGGCLRLKSQKGVGTTAELWLLVATAAPESIPVKTSEPAVEVADRKVSVLTVDDDALVLMNTVIMLEDLGHTVLSANSAQGALDILEHGTLPDVIITDHAMPHITGAELAKKVRLLYPEIKIIIASGYAELPEPGTMMRRLQKPFSQQQLREALSAAVATGTKR